ncbi:MAG: NAD/NADP octopine/nopaline dehydrogenase family protein [Synergistales bacterium]|nr:NAD/NADP octopine/nopaline dehydrogenase family protein [Synergistales bacterium]
MKKIAVLGAGNGGQALSGHLAMKGNDVRLYEHPAFADKLEKIKQQGGIELNGAIEGFGRLRASSDMEEVLEGTEVVYVVVPSFGQIPIMKEALPYIEEGMKFIFIPGNFGSLEAMKLMKDKGVRSDVLLCETDTLPYACRADAPGKVHVWGLKKGMSIAALPASLTEDLISHIQEVFPIPLHPAGNVLSIAFSNLNMIVHCAAVLLNAGRIEGTGGDFRFYTDGITPAVGRLEELLDAERVKVGDAYHLGLIPAVEWIKKAYPVDGESIYELLSKNPVYAKHGSDAPKTVKHRYVTEDVPNLLVPVVSFARAAGVETPLTDSLITLLSAINGDNYLEEGRNLSRLGLEGVSMDQILEKIS